MRGVPCFARSLFFFTVFFLFFLFCCETWCRYGDVHDVQFRLKRFFNRAHHVKNSARFGERDFFFSGGTILPHKTIEMLHHTLDGLSFALRPLLWRETLLEARLPHKTIEMFHTTLLIRLFLCCPQGKMEGRIRYLYFAVDIFPSPCRLTLRCCVLFSST